MFWCIGRTIGSNLGRYGRLCYFLGLENGNKLQITVICVLIECSVVLPKGDGFVLVEVMLVQYFIIITSVAHNLLLVLSSKLIRRTC